MTTTIPWRSYSQTGSSARFINRLCYRPRQVFPTRRFASEYASPGSKDLLMTTLPDERTLSWKESGDPKGRPVFVLLGHPLSVLRDEVQRLSEETGRRHNIRFIRPNRPGLRQSTKHPGRLATDWPLDVQSLVRHLQLDRYAVLGCSSGSPWALAWDTSDLARDVYLLANPWGFRLEDVRYPGVQIWHGIEDVKVSPIQVVR
ncbi:hypothetical protein PG988_000063 [Apiospora saccharicola]